MSNKINYYAILPRWLQDIYDEKAPGWRQMGFDVYDAPDLLDIDTQSEYTEYITTNEREK